MTGEQLERASWDEPDTTATCNECGRDFDTDKEIYAEGKNETVCCAECFGNSAIIVQVMNHDDFYNANASFGNVDICITDESRAVAISMLSDWLEGGFSNNIYVSIESDK